MHDASAHVFHGLNALGLAGEAGVVAALLVAGLIGGLAHCGAMCGPFVLSQTGARLAAQTAAPAGLARLSGALLLPYHLGRVTTYAALGALAAAAVGGVAPVAGWVPVAFLLAGAFLFMAAGARGLGLALPRLGPTWRGPDGTAVFTRSLRALSRSPYGWRGYALGVALGFLPCGLLYAAIAAAAGTGRPATAALGMAAFGLGTAPSLFAVGLAGHFAARRWRDSFGRIAPALLIVNGVALIFMAWRTVA